LHFDFRFSLYQTLFHLAFGLLRLQRSADQGEVWLDARRTLASYGLEAREQLEYRIVERNIDVVSRDGRASRSVMLSERDPISVCGLFLPPMPQSNHRLSLL
jgi:hypothetical protein